MKRNYNKHQEVYMLAKAHLEALEQESNRNESIYIKTHDIVNPDGAVPELIYMIEDEQLFEKVNAEYSERDDASKIWNEILKAREILKEAETNLITYGLSIIPSKMGNERKTLEKAVKENYTVRMKIIDLVLNLDTKTVIKPTA